MTKKPIPANKFNGLQSKNSSGKMYMTCADIRTVPTITPEQRKLWNKAQKDLWDPLIKECKKIMKRHKL